MVASIVAKIISRLFSARYLPIQMLQGFVSITDCHRFSKNNLPPAKAKVTYGQRLPIPSLLLWQIPVRPKAERIGVHFWIVHHSPDVRVHYGALGNEHAIVYVIGDASMGNAQGR